MMKAMEVARRDGRIPFVSEQIHYTLQAREAEYELLPIALDQKLAVLVWSPIAGGLLSGKHRRNKAAPEGNPPGRGLERAAGSRRKRAVGQSSTKLVAIRRNAPRLRGASRAGRGCSAGRG